MTVTDQNFEIYSGDSADVYITVYDRNGNPKDIDGCTFTWDVKRYPPSVSLVSKDSEAGITIVEGDSGVLRVHLLPEDTQALRGVYFHVCRMTDTNLDVTTVCTGLLRVKYVQRGD